DADNYYVDLFSVYEDGEKVLHVYGYTMQPGDRMLDVSQPLKRLHAGGAGFVKPRWDEDTAAWVEGATAEELAAWEAKHPAPEVDLDTLRAAKQEQNKQALADWLAAHPLTWTDGNVYGVTEEDQNEMAINLAQYQLAIAAGQPAVIEWHAQKQQCHTFTIEQYTALSLAIAAYVYPYRRYQEQVKAAIYAAQSKEELDAIEIDYSRVGTAA
ncbi:MAG TPA: hypothetical protein H9832_07125, partial [Candidatus Agathobaculum merdavium]|nr:hypothetical protein [Candidatus Agathobaculum merdavium]